MEKQGYYDNLERIHAMYPDKEYLRKTEVAKFLGVKYQTAGKRFKFKDNYISKANLARALS